MSRSTQAKFSELILSARQIILILLISLAFFALQWFSFSRLYLKEIFEASKSQLEEQISPLVYSLSNTINYQFSELEGLRALIYTHSDYPSLASDYPIYAAYLYEKNTATRGIQLFHQNNPVIVYPIEGNEEVLGRTMVDLINDERPDVYVDVQRALATREIAISGPYELRQGGLGLVARLPVYMQNELTYMAVIILDVPDLLNSAGVAAIEENYRIAIKDADGNVFHGSADLFDDDSVILSIPLVEGEWTLAAQPIEGWVEYNEISLWAFNGAFWILAVILTFVLLLGISRQLHLQTENVRLDRMVEEKTLVLQSTISQLEDTTSALEDYQDDLEVIIAERTAELDKTYRQLEDEVKQRQRIFINMGHELRTPLTAIIGTSEIMLADRNTKLSSKQEKHIRTIIESGQQLLSLINDLLSLEKLSAKQMEMMFEITNLDLLCSSVITQSGLLADKKQIQIQYENENRQLMVELDPVRIKQVLINLLNNALKFTPENGQVGLKVQSQKGMVKITVWDSGIGISQEDFAVLFQPFRQIDSKLSRNYEGAGLGLAISKQLIEMHQGKIELSSQVDSGSHFIVTLPMKQ